MQAIFDVALQQLHKQQAKQLGLFPEFLEAEITQSLRHRCGLIADKDETSMRRVLVLGPFFETFKGHVTQSCDSITVLELLAPGEGRSQLPFDDETFSFVIDLMGLHGENEIDRALAETRRVLTPGGHLLSVLLGEQTLTELRHTLIQADLQLYQGAVARVSPMIQAKIWGHVLMSMGFQNPVADHQTLMVQYPTLKRLVADLRAMGETKALVQAKTPGYRRDYFTIAEQLYRQQYGTVDGYLPATFDVLYGYGQKP